MKLDEALSSERETGGWQLLQMTPLSAGAILRGKLLSVAWPLFLVLLAVSAAQLYLGRHHLRAEGHE